MTQKILMCGDVHAMWGSLSNLINKKNPDIVLQCGDFGAWPGEVMYKNNLDFFMKRNGKQIWPPNIRLKNTKLYFSMGNHENWWYIQEKYGRSGPTPIEIEPNIFYCPLKSTLTLPDGRTVLFMGGAESIDKDQRTIGVDWFPEEILTYGDTIELPDVKADIIVSHTCPVEFDMSKVVNTASEKSKDPSKEALSLLLNYYKPSLWYFGHYHKYKSGFDKGCKWFALNMAALTNWWKWLEK